MVRRGSAQASTIVNRETGYRTIRHEPLASYRSFFKARGSRATSNRSDFCFEWI